MTPFVQDYPILTIVIAVVLALVLSACMAYYVLLTTKNAGDDLSPDLSGDWMAENARL